MKKIVIAGGTGYIGSFLTKYFAEKGYSVLILTRTLRKDHPNVTHIRWDAQSTGQWTKTLENAEALINLNGKSVDCRYTQSNKKEIYASRIETTEILGNAISECSNPPKVWINASSATIYPHSVDQPMTEQFTDFDQDFSVDVCKKWEASFNRFQLPAVRKVILRIAIVLGKESAVMKPLKLLTRAGLGGRHGAGNQMISWIHERDLAGIVNFCITNPHISGVYNAASPEPVTNSNFMEVLRKQLQPVFHLPIPEFLLEVGAFFIRTETELILKSRYVLPEKIVEAGYNFRYPQLDQALGELYRDSSG